MKKFLIIALSIISFSASAQLMSFGFIKNATTYNRTAFENELFKKHYFKTGMTVENPANAMLNGAVPYSNEQRPAEGEIKVLSLITDKQKITEIEFANGATNNWSKNYTEVYNQMVSFFNNQSTFKSSKYDNADVTKFTNDNVYYYSYKRKNNMVIVVSDK